jgi:hypothetical protein
MLKRHILPIPVCPDPPLTIHFVSPKPMPAQDLHEIHLSKHLSRKLDPNDIYIVVKVDSDGSAQLLDPAMATDPKSYGMAFWCRPHQPLRQGQRVQGILEFHPSESIALRRLPTFTLNRLVSGEAGWEDLR